MFLAKLTLSLGLFCIAVLGQAAEKPSVYIHNLKSGETVSQVVQFYTGRAENWRTGSVWVVSHETMKIVPKGERRYRRLHTGDMVVIHSSLIPVKEVETNTQDLSQFCGSYTTVNCVERIRSINELPESTVSLPPIVFVPTWFTPTPIVPPPSQPAPAPAAKAQAPAPQPQTEVLMTPLGWVFLSLLIIASLVAIYFAIQQRKYKRELEDDRLENDHLRREHLARFQAMAQVTQDWRNDFIIILTKNLELAEIASFQVYPVGSKVLVLVDKRDSERASEAVKKTINLPRYSFLIGKEFDHLEIHIMPK